VYIKEIEFVNFKSFGKKVKIPFFDDFTTISGPNGSGKSNIIDGILFVLGLSSSRTMRAEKLTDLIYSGNPGKKPDYAQVTLHFNNEDRELPVDADEVVISRKVRSTDSGYYSYFYFNGKSASLTEVHNYLAKARVTPEGYNVVMQGDVTRIFTMTPTERRKIIDEIAGVSEFDSKKERALNELEIVRERVERADILIEEVENQLNKLKSERDQAVRYRSLREEKMKYEGFVLLAKLKDAKTEFARVEEELATKGEAMKGLEEELQARKDKLEAFENELRELNLTIQKMGEEEQIRIKKEIEGLRGEIGRCNDRIELSEREIDENDSRRRRVFVEIDEAKEKITGLDRALEEKNVQREGIEAEISEKKTQRLVLQSRIADVDEEFARTRDELVSLRDGTEKLRSEKNELMRQEDRILDSLRRKSAEAADIQREIGEAKQKAESAESDTGSVKYDIGKLNGRIGELTRDIDDFESNRRQVKQELTGLTEDIRNKQHSFAMLEARVRAAEDSGSYSRAVEAVLQEKKHHGLPGIHGTIAQLGRTDQKFATALEIAAGGRMQGIVVDSDEDAARAIDYLKRRKAGRATFLPLNKMESRRPGKNVSGKKGFVGYAIDLIDFDPKFDGAFWYVFRDTLVMDTLENARKLMGNLRMVTLEGELIEKSGAMSGGSQRKSGLSFAASEKGKLHKLAEELTELESGRDALIRKLDSVDGHIAAVNRDIGDCEKEISKKQMELEEIATRGERLGQLIETRDRDLTEIEEQRRQLREEMEKVVAEKEEKETLEKENAGRIQALEKELAGSEIPELNRQAEEMDEEIHRLEGRIRDIEGQVNAINLDREYAEKSIQNNRELIAEMDARKTEKQELIAGLRQEIARLETLLAEKNSRETELEGELRQLQQQRADKEKQRDIYRQDFENARERNEKARTQLDALKATRRALAEQAEELRQELARRGIEETEEVPGYETVRTRIASIEKAMEALEPVNMRAIDEYEEVEGRLVDLKSRRAILFNEREQILERIDQYEHLKKETFMETYNGINAAFSEIFHELSDGEGELMLDDEEDPFAGGMTLRASPKDKTVQRLEAMSGGEKSLTALAFLFAIQQYRPAPFYAFDEIDMFLDGYNADKVAQRIMKSSANAQFIVVSLRKPMIESAVRTIGVTMQQNNITSITGVKIR
jgi:chromosome segregation protein